MDAAAVAIYPTAYALTYFSAIGMVELWESYAPRRRLMASLSRRWVGNFALTFLNTFVVWALFPLFSVGFAAVAAERGWGLSRGLNLPYPVAFVGTLIVLDVGHYVLHRSLHDIPVLWRAHRIHHTDHDYDFTTGLRFHPIEMGLTVLVAFALVAGLGLPPGGVVAYELIFVVTAMFAHANARIPLNIERRLRLFVVTPDLHRVHHSNIASETNSNYGGSVPWWDRLFGTYVDQPSRGHENMTIGLDGYQGAEHLGLARMLADPFLPPELTSDEAYRADTSNSSVTGA